MTSGPILSLRSERTTAARGPSAAPRGSAASGGEEPATIAAMHQAFDFEAAERAEILREQDVLQAMLMAYLKNEDEIMKKWIALI